MHHDDDVRPFRQGEPVAAFLISAVSEIFLVRKNDCVGQTFGQGRGFIPAGVIHDDDACPRSPGHDLVESLDEGFGRVVGGHDHHYFFA